MYCSHCVCQDPSLLLALAVIGVTVLLFALKNMNSRRRDLITLQDPDAKYPLPLIEKEVVGQPNPSPWLGERQETEVVGNVGWESGVDSHIMAQWSSFPRNLSFPARVLEPIKPVSVLFY